MMIVSPAAARVATTRRAGPAAATALDLTRAPAKEEPRTAVRGVRRWKGRPLLSATYRRPMEVRRLSGPLRAIDSVVDWLHGNVIRNPGYFR